jgi:hypothetical protein
MTSRALRPNDRAAVNLRNDWGAKLHRQVTPRPVQHGGGVELIPVLHSIRTASASRESRRRRSLLRGEIRRQLLEHLLTMAPS